MVPFHCGALLPIDQRYTSPSYRRVAGRFDAASLSPSEAAELIAFVDLVGLQGARFIFRWRTIKEFQRLLSVSEYVLLSERYKLANEAELDERSAQAVLTAMIEGGFKHGRPPALVRNWLAMRRKRGESVKKIAATLPGITHWQVQEWLMTRKPPMLRRARAMGLLTVSGA